MAYERISRMGDVMINETQCDTGLTEFAFYTPPIPPSLLRDLRQVVDDAARCAWTVYGDTPRDDATFTTKSGAVQRATRLAQDAYDRDRAAARHRATQTQDA